jgi:O-methyltransferase
MSLEDNWHSKEQLQAFLLQYGCRESDNLKKLREASATHSCGQMQISPELGQFLKFLIRAAAVKNILELGTFMGYSSLAMAEALPDEGQIVTCDMNHEWTVVARAHFRSAQLDHKIHLRLGDGQDTLIALSKELPRGYFDLAFIDADKKNYLNYYQLVFPLVRQGGVIILDNIFYSGRIFDVHNQKDSTQGIREINAFLKDDPRVEISMLPIDDGITLAWKR